MKRYKLHVNINAIDGDEYQYVMNILRTSEYSYTYIKGIAPPHKMEFTFDGLSEDGLNTMKSWWRALKLPGGNFTIVETFG